MPRDVQGVDGAAGIASGLIVFSAFASQEQYSSLTPIILYYKTPAWFTEEPLKQAITDFSASMLTSTA